MKYDKWKFLKDKYSPDEQLVINRSSIFNGIKVNPWLPEDGVVNIVRERLYEDPDGYLPLSNSQATKFVGYKRPRDFVPKKFRTDGIIPINRNITGFEINQSSVGDCSVISSLALCAHMECKMGYTKSVVTGNIYPQDLDRNPIYNPFGQYVVRLYVNGLWRAVRIDDFFPVDRHNNLICCYSKKGNLWCSLLEKAYLKMCNGYDFRGSNTSRDLFIFTSWLPEKKHFNKIDDLDNLWDRLVSADKTRDVMVSISTGDLPNAEELGLVENHAYAVLEFVEFGEERFMLVLNPWGKFFTNSSSENHIFVWRGDTIDDEEGISKELARALCIDNFKGEDKGLCWVEFKTV